MLTILLSALYLVGLFLTGWGLFNAVITTQRDIAAARDRIPLMERLEAKQSAETDALQWKQDREMDEQRELLGRPLTSDERIAIHARFTPDFAQLHAAQDAEYLEHELVRPTLAKLAHLAQHESEWLLQRILSSNRGNLILLGAGLVVTTIASIWSLFA
ncbi:hypothetical protein ACWPKO_22555 (plasmid) [Coraliomargarita sp. W4R53]